MFYTNYIGVDIMESSSEFQAKIYIVEEFKKVTNKVEELERDVDYLRFELTEAYSMINTLQQNTKSN